MSRVTYHVSHVKYNMSCVTDHVSCVTYNFLFIFFTMWFKAKNMLSNILAMISCAEVKYILCISVTRFAYKYQHLYNSAVLRMFHLLSSYSSTEEVATGTVGGNGEEINFHLIC